MLLEVNVERKHRTKSCQTRGRGGPGGWVWASDCRCGWRAFTGKLDYVEEQVTGHLNEEQTMVDVLDDVGYVTFRTAWFLADRPNKMYWQRSGQMDV